ncbi:MAG: DUF4920 domain-containing protein [Lysobacterales bacterium]
MQTLEGKSGPKTLAVMGLLLVLVSGLSPLHGEVIRLSEPVAQDAHSETFGAQMPDGNTEMTLSQVMSEPARFADQTVMVSARVDKVCQKKGCFFIAQDEDALVRVAFKDYGFFVPTDIAGRRVTLAGQLVKREISAEQAQHYRADLGGAGPTIEAGLVYEIIASAVRVPTDTSG